MTQYIDKDVLVAEIERLTKKNELYLDDNVSDVIRFQKTSAYNVLCDLRHFLDTLEVREVDLEKEIQTLWSLNQKHVDSLFIPMNYNGLREIAKHFFELGMMSQRTNIFIPDLDDIIKKQGVNPESNKAKIFKEAFYKAISKLEAQKEK